MLCHPCCMLCHPCCMLHHAHRLLHYLLHWSLWHSHHALRASDHYLLCCHLMIICGQVAGDAPLLTGCVQYSPGVAPHTKMATERALLSLCVQLLLCLQPVRASIHCLVAMLPACLEGLEDLLPHTGVLVDGFVGLCHHLDLGGVALCRHILPLQLLLHGAGGLCAIHGSRLGHHIMEAARHQHTLHSHVLLVGRIGGLHVVEGGHPLMLVLLLLSGCELLPLIWRSHHCCVLLLLVGGGQVLLVGSVPLPHPPLLVHLHSLLLLLGVGQMALWSPHLVYVVLLMMGAHPCCGGRGVVLRSGVAGR